MRAVGSALVPLHTLHAVAAYTLMQACKAADATHLLQLHCCQTRSLWAQQHIHERHNSKNSQIRCCCVLLLAPLLMLSTHHRQRVLPCCCLLVSVLL